MKSEDVSSGTSQTGHSSYPNSECYFDSHYFWFTALSDGDYYFKRDAGTTVLTITGTANSNGTYGTPKPFLKIDGSVMYVACPYWDGSSWETDIYRFTAYNTYSTHTGIGNVNYYEALDVFEYSGNIVVPLFKPSSSAVVFEYTATGSGSFTSVYLPNISTSGYDIKRCIGGWHDGSGNWYYAVNEDSKTKLKVYTFYDGNGTEITSYNIAQSNLIENDNDSYTQWMRYYNGSFFFFDDGDVYRGKLDVTDSYSKILSGDAAGIWVNTDDEIEGITFLDGTDAYFYRVFSTGGIERYETTESGVSSISACSAYGFKYDTEYRTATQTTYSPLQREWLHQFALKAPTYEIHTADSYETYLHLYDDSNNPIFIGHLAKVFKDANNPLVQLTYNSIIQSDLKRRITTSYTNETLLDIVTGVLEEGGVILHAGSIADTGSYSIVMENMQIIEFFKYLYSETKQMPVWDADGTVTFKDGTTDSTVDVTSSNIISPLMYREETQNYGSVILRGDGITVQASIDNGGDDVYYDSYPYISSISELQIIASNIADLQFNQFKKIDVIVDSCGLLTLGEYVDVLYTVGTIDVDSTYIITGMDYISNSDSAKLYLTNALFIEIEGDTRAQVERNSTRINDIEAGELGPHSETHENGGDDELSLDTSQITTGTFANARISSSSVTQHEGDLSLDATQISSGDVSNTEFDYLNGVTSAIQTQLNNRYIVDEDLEVESSDPKVGVRHQTTNNLIQFRAYSGGDCSIYYYDGSMDGLHLLYWDDSEETIQLGSNIEEVDADTLKIDGTAITATAAELNTVADGSTAKNSHNHDDRYYTESQIDGFNYITAAEAITAVEGESTLDLTGAVSISDNTLTMNPTNAGDTVIDCNNGDIIGINALEFNDYGEGLVVSGVSPTVMEFSPESSGNWELIGNLTMDGNISIPDGHQLDLLGGAVTDNNCLRMGYTDYGYYFKYTGSGSGDSNYLELWSENNNGTDELLMRFHHTSQQVEFAGAIDIGSIAAGSSDYDKFLVSDSGVIKYRTGIQVKSDIGLGNVENTALSTWGGDSTNIEVESSDPKIGVRHSTSNNLIQFRAYNGGDCSIYYYDGSASGKHLLYYDESEDQVKIHQAPLILENGTSINEFSTDDTLAGDSDDAVPTEQAVKAYVDDNFLTNDGDTTTGTLYFDGGGSATGGFWVRQSGTNYGLFNASNGNGGYFDLRDSGGTAKIKLRGYGDCEFEASGTCDFQMSLMNPTNNKWVGSTSENWARVYATYIYDDDGNLGSFDAWDDLELLRQIQTYDRLKTTEIPLRDENGDVMLDEKGEIQYHEVEREVIDARTLPWYKAFNLDYQHDKTAELEFSFSDKLGFILSAEKKLVEYCDHQEQRIQQLEQENTELRNRLTRIEQELGL